MPLALLLCGPSLAGKSTTACVLAKALDAVVVNSDEINEERGLPFGAEGLPESVWAETLEIQLQRMRSLAAAGKSVIVDDTLCYRWLRDRHRQEAIAAGLKPVLLLVAPPPSVIVERHQSLSASRERPVLGFAQLSAHLQAFEWPVEEEQAVDLTTSQSLWRFIESTRGVPTNAA